MRAIEFRPRASADLDGILASIALTLKSPQEHPTYRRKLVKRYWVYYTYTDDTLTVRRIFHTTQDTDCYGFEILDD